MLCYIDQYLSNILMIYSFLLIYSLLINDGDLANSFKPITKSNKVDIAILTIYAYLIVWVIESNTLI